MFGLYSGVRLYFRICFARSDLRQIPSVPALRRARLFNYLRRLQAGGRSNMFGAIPYLMRAFSLDRDTAFRVVCEWEDAQSAQDDTTARTV
jgi:hypothetical protein